MQPSSRTFTLNNESSVSSFNAFLNPSSTLPSSAVTFTIDSSITNPTVTVTIDPSSLKISSYSFSIDYSYFDVYGMFYQETSSSIQVIISHEVELYALTSGNIVKTMVFTSNFSINSQSQLELTFYNMNDLEIYLKYNIVASMLYFQDPKYAIWTNGVWHSSWTYEYYGTFKWEESSLTLFFGGVPFPYIVSYNQFDSSTYTGSCMCDLK